MRTRIAAAGAAVAVLTLAGLATPAWADAVSGGARNCGTTIVRMNWTATSTGGAFSTQASGSPSWQTSVYMTPGSYGPLTGRYSITSWTAYATNGHVPAASSSCSNVG